jgi:hypothetical protein
MKTCYKCKETKELTCFSKHASRKDGLSAQCKTCHKIMRKTHYESNKSKIIQQVSNKKIEYNKWLNELKNKPCADCNKSYPYYVMDFDHVTGIKIFNIANARQKIWSKDKVLKEINKCELVCANCHRERTYKRKCDSNV